jgi:hypothetical protein
MTTLPPSQSPDSKTHILLPVVAIVILFLVLLARAAAA